MDDEVRRERSALLARPCGKLANRLYDEYRFARL